MWREGGSEAKIWILVKPRARSEWSRVIRKENNNWGKTPTSHHIRTLASLQLQFVPGWAIEEKDAKNMRKNFGVFVLFQGAMTKTTSKTNVPNINGPNMLWRRWGDPPLASSPSSRGISGGGCCSTGEDSTSTFLILVFCRFTLCVFLGVSVWSWPPASPCSASSSCLPR